MRKKENEKPLLLGPHHWLGEEVQSIDGER